MIRRRKIRKEEETNWKRKDDLGIEKEEEGGGFRENEED